MLGVVGVNFGADCWEEESGSVRSLYPGGCRLEEILLEVNGVGRWKVDGKSVVTDVAKRKVGAISDKHDRKIPVKK